MKKISLVVLTIFLFALSSSAQSMTSGLKKELSDWIKKTYSNSLDFSNQLTIRDIMETNVPGCKDWERGAYLKIMDNIDEYPQYLEIILMGIYTIHDGNINDAYISLRNILSTENIEIANKIWNKKYKANYEQAKKKRIEEEQRKEQQRIDAEKDKERKRIAAEKEAERRKIAAEKEAERKRIEEEKRRQAEIERQKKERRNRIDAFLAKVDKNVVYDISDEYKVIYETIDTELSDALKLAVAKYNPDNIELEVVDNLIIDNEGKTSHEITITAQGDLTEDMENGIKSTLSKIRFQPLLRATPHMDTLYSITAKDRFVLNHKIVTEKENFSLIKKKNEVKLLKGNKDFYTSNITSIDHSLNGKGKYQVAATRRIVDGNPFVTVDIKDFRKPVDNVMIGYTFSNAAPLGLSVALNGIYSKHWGVYCSFRTSVKSANRSDLESNEVLMGLEKSGYSCFNFSIGGTYSVTKYGYLYAGLGYGQCGVIYSSSDIDINKYHTTVQNRDEYRFTGDMISGINLDFGLVVRPIKWVGLSVGYNFVPAKQFYGEVNFGVVFFI